MLPIFMLIYSSILVVSTNYWILIWIILEINILAFIINISKEKNKERTLIYFLFQVFSSIMLIIYLFIERTIINQRSTKTLTYLIILAIILKTGIFPFHSWLIEISLRIYWINISILLTWQKIIPLIILLKISQKININKIAILSIVPIRVVILSISNTKKIIVLSSLIHNGWIILSIKLFKIISLFYIVIYSVILLIINIFLIVNRIKKILSQLKEKKTFFNLSILIFSIAGIPPSIGFLLKLRVIFSLILNKIPIRIIISIILISRLSFLAYFQIFQKILKLIKNINLKELIMKKNKKRVLIWLNLIPPILIIY